MHDLHILTSALFTPISSTLHEPGSYLDLMHHIHQKLLPLHFMRQWWPGECSDYIHFLSKAWGQRILSFCKEPFNISKKAFMFLQ